VNTSGNQLAFNQVSQEMLTCHSWKRGLKHWQWRPYKRTQLDSNQKST